ncbi:hypothetical protein M8J77_015361 [Diaphorina citri]|nr:hypothetical protein M8J77_015361 [Diaphorina citri]
MALTAKFSQSGASSFPIGSPGEAVMSDTMIKKHQLRRKIKIGTWNVKTMAQQGKIYNATKEMRRMKIDILGISEMRWPSEGSIEVDEHRVFYSGAQDNKYMNGVGIIVSKTIANSVTNFIPFSERLILIQISATPVNLNIIQVYAPTADKPDTEVEELYNSINQIYEKLPKQDATIIMGDFNAKLGAGQKTEFVGMHGLGERNERGDTLEKFAEQHSLVVLNTQFKQHPRRLYTWKSPLDKPGRTVRNQIDFVMINKRYRNSCTSMRTYPGADMNSDHVPVIGEFKVVLKKVGKKKEAKTNMRQLKEPRIKEKKDLNEKLERFDETATTEEQLTYLKQTIEEIKKTHLNEKEKREKRKSWMTDDILDLMEIRRTNKGNLQEYRRINATIRREIRKAKEAEQQEKCLEIEAYQRKYDEFNVHRKVKEVTGAFKKRSYGKLMDQNGNILIDATEKKNAWVQYIEKLFEDHRNNIAEEIRGESGPLILESEVRAAINQMKEGKAVGPDNIQAEFMKLIDEDNLKGITKLYNNIYASSQIPQEWLISEFIALPKKNGAKKCEDYRTISLMSHLLKIFLKTIHRRIYNRCESQISQNQFGFVNAVGTREALFAVQVLVQRCRDVNCDVYSCLIDYQKAFDRVQHEHMIKILKKTGVDDKDLKIITNLYWNQSATIRVDGEQTEAIKIERGVRQGCILSPLLFNIYSEQIFKEALEEVDEGIPLNGERLNNIRYADDTIVFSDSLEGLQSLVNKIAAVSAKYGLDINSKKTKFMAISKSNVANANITINNQPIERVTQSSYLGTIINENWDNSQEVRSRIAKATAAFNKMSKIFKSHDLTISTKVRLLKCYIFSILLYGVESWTLNENTTKKLEAFEMWLYRRILKISWIEHVTNEEVLRRMKKERELMNIIKVRKLQYLGHIMRNDNKYTLLQLIIQGKIEGKRGRGRRRISWLHNLRKWTGKTSTELFRIAVNKIKLAKLVANIRNG